MAAPTQRGRVAAGRGAPANPRTPPDQRAPQAPARRADGRAPGVAPRTRVPAPQRSTKRRRVAQGRRVRRVVRRIDVWTVLKLSFLFYLAIGLVLMIAGVILWDIASTFHVISNVEKFIKSLLDLATFTLQGHVIFEAGAAGCGIVVLLGTGINVLSAVLYNLMSDLVGGIQVIVLEEQEEG